MRTSKTEVYLMDVASYTCLLAICDNGRDVRLLHTGDEWMAAVFAQRIAESIPHFKHIKYKK